MTTKGEEKKTRPAHTAQEAADAIGVALGQIVKSLVFMAPLDPARDDGELQLVVALVRGTDRVDVGKLASAAARPRLRRATAREAREATGFAIGGVAPVGHLNPIRAWIDPRLMAFDTVWAAAGTPRSVFPAEPRALADAVGGAVVVVVGAVGVDTVVYPPHAWSWTSSGEGTLAEVRDVVAHGGGYAARGYAALGYHAAFLGHVGDDEHGRRVRDTLGNDGIVMDYGQLTTASIHYSGPFKNGQVAMLPMGSWFIGSLIQAQNEGEFDFDWGVASPLEKVIHGPEHLALLLTTVAAAVGAARLADRLRGPHPWRQLPWLAAGAAVVAAAVRAPGAGRGAGRAVGAVLPLVLRLPLPQHRLRQAAVAG